MTAIVKYLQLEDCTWVTGRILLLRLFQCANNPPSQSLQKVTLQVWSALQCHGVQGFHSVERPHLHQCQTHPGSGWYSSANWGMSYCWLLPGEGTSMTHLPKMLSFSFIFIQTENEASFKNIQYRRAVQHTNMQKTTHVPETSFWSKHWILTVHELRTTSDSGEVKGVAVGQSRHVPTHTFVCRRMNIWTSYTTINMKKIHEDSFIQSGKKAVYSEKYRDMISLQTSTEHEL